MMYPLVRAAGRLAPSVGVCCSPTDGKHKPPPDDAESWLHSTAAPYFWTPPDPRDDDGRVHVLVIEDNTILRDLFRDLLEEERYRVTLTPFVPQDLAPIVRLAPDVILLDLLFGERPLGFELLQRLRHDEGTAAIPVVVCSAALDLLRNVQPELRAQGIVALVKPFDIAELLAAIAASCATQATGSGQELGGRQAASRRRRPSHERRPARNA